jgi:hypothetical protein
MKLNARRANQRETGDMRDSLAARKPGRHHARHLFVTTPSFNSTNAVPDFSLLLVPPKMRKIAGSRWRRGSRMTGGRKRRTRQRQPPNHGKSTRS